MPFLKIKKCTILYVHLIKFFLISNICKSIYFKLQIIFALFVAHKILKKKLNGDDKL